MSAATLCVPTYPLSDLVEDDPSKCIYFDERPTIGENTTMASDYTISDFIDELSDYSDEAKASILRGLEQTETESLGSFAEYAEE